MKKLIFILLTFIAFNTFTGFNIQRIPRWFQGIWDYNKEKYRSAETQFEKAKSGENDAVMSYNQGTALYKEEMYEEAEEAFTKATEVDPQFEKAFYNQGNARFKKGDLRGAIESYEKALEIDPNDEDARYNLEYVKKLLEQMQNSAGDTTDSQENQQRENPQSTEKETKDSKDSGSEDLTGKEQKDEQDLDKQGESAGGEKKEDVEKENSSGGPKKEDDDEEEPEKPKDMPKENQSGMSDERIKEILEALAEEEKSLAGKLDRKDSENQSSPTDPFGIFDELFSIADDLDPFATPKQRKRKKDEVDW